MNAEEIERIYSVSVKLSDCRGIFCSGDFKINVGFRIRHLSDYAGHFVLKKCLCLEFGVGLSICRFRVVSDWTGSTVIRVQKLVGLPPPHSNYLGVFRRFRRTFAKDNTFGGASANEL